LSKQINSINVEILANNEKNKCKVLFVICTLKKSLPTERLWGGVKRESLYLLGEGNERVVIELYPVRSRLLKEMTIFISKRLAALFEVILS